MRVPTLARNKVREIWLDPEATASALIVAFLDHYGMEGLEWDPQTIHQEVEEDFHVELSRPIFDRLMAAIVIVTTDQFYKSLPDFITLCNILNGDSFDPTVFDPADAAECALGIVEVLLLDPPDEDEPFVQEIREYIGHAVRFEGLVKPPDILRLGNVDDTARVYELADDPVIFNSAWDREKSQSEDINRRVKERIELIMNQIESLSLRHGDASKLVEKMRGNQGKAEMAASRGVLSP